MSDNEPTANDNAEPAPQQITVTDHVMMVIQQAYNNLAGIDIGTMVKETQNQIIEMLASNPTLAMDDPRGFANLRATVEYISVADKLVSGFNAVLTKQQEGHRLAQEKNQAQNPPAADPGTGPETSDQAPSAEENVSPGRKIARRRRVRD